MAWQVGSNKPSFLPFLFHSGYKLIGWCHQYPGEGSLVNPFSQAQDCAKPINGLTQYQMPMVQHHTHMI